MPAHPAVPPVAGLGLGTDLTVLSWQGVFARAGTPREAIAALHQATTRAVAAPEMRTRMEALAIEPAFIASLASAGYRNLSADEVEQMAALNIDPAFISSFARIGYANLPVDTLVQLKALDVTPEFVERLRRSGIVAESADKLVALKAIGDDAARKRR